MKTNTEEKYERKARTLLEQLQCDEKVLIQIDVL